jgi:hypothetical protein
VNTPCEHSIHARRGKAAYGEPSGGRTDKTIILSGHLIGLLSDRRGFNEAKSSRKSASSLKFEECFCSAENQPSQSAEKPTDEVRRFVACPEMTGQEMTGQDKYRTSFHNPERFYEKVVKPYGPKLDPESAENPAQSIGRKPGRSSSTGGAVT